MFRIKDVEHRYGERTVLRDVSVELSEHRVAVIGANGSGKSTFARLLNGLVVPTSGTVTVDGLDTHKEGRKVRARVGFVFQDPDLQIVMPTVAEDLAFGLKYRGLSKAEIADRVDRALDTYGLRDFRDHPAHLLSGGQKQRLAIASVLALAPRYVVFDEPTTMLDLRSKRQVTRIIAALEQPVVVVSHDMDLLADFDRVLVFDEGRLVADGRPATSIAAYLELMDAC
ncbi:energy-coupling factor ABC transporter ATP-binding protein [Kitasatospora sp. NPDC101235]|uniref:energy-coupling factor ABC transporter ATP-binding protein n=1 Tax=Kitasatospora sp. NPDC101235 TaxID=3364101 RepID=UPI00382E1350